MHQQKIGAAYTSTRLPVELVFLQEFGTRDEALLAERQIKGWSRKKKQALIMDNWDMLIALSNNKNKRSYPSILREASGQAHLQEGPLVLSLSKWSGRTE